MASYQSRMVSLKDVIYLNISVSEQVFSRREIEMDKIIHDWFDLYDQREYDYSCDVMDWDYLPEDIDFVPIRHSEKEYEESVRNWLCDCYVGLDGFDGFNRSLDPDKYELYWLEELYKDWIPELNGK